MKRQSLPLLVFLACSFPTLAQSPPPGTVHDIPWPTLELGAPGVFERALFGHFFGDHSPDAALLAGDRAFLLYQPQFHESFVELRSGVLDIASVVGREVFDPTGLALSHADGVDLYVHPGPATTISAAAGLALLCSANLDGIGMSDLVGASGNELRYVRHDGTSWTTLPAIATGGSVLDVQAVDWDADGRDEIAALTTQGLALYGESGVLLEFFVGPASSGRIAPIAPRISTEEARVAWAFPLGSASLLLVCSPGGARENCGYFSAAPAALAAATYHDAEQHRRTDLATVTSADLALRTFEHQPTGSSYMPAAASHSWIVGANGPNGDGRIAFADITDDDVPDVLVPRDGDDALYFVPGEPMSFAGKAFTSEEPFVYPQLVVDVHGGYWFQTHLVVPEPSAPFTHVQLQLWSSPDGDVLEEVAVGNGAFRIGDSEFAPDGHAGNMRIALLLVDQPACAPLGGYYLTLRLVTLDAFGKITGASAALDAGFTKSGGILTKMDPEEDLRIDLHDDSLCGDVLAPAFVREPLWGNLPPPLVPKPGVLVTTPAMPDVSTEQ